MRHCGSIVLLIAGIGLLAGSAAAENWGQWRGPALNGSTTETNLPATLTVAENLLWSAQLPGHGAGTPIVWGDRVFVSSLEKDSSKLIALCFQRQTGKELWRKEVGMVAGSAPGRMNDVGSPSAITDGKSVWFYFGTGDLAAFDMDGKPLWARNIASDHGKFNMLFLYGSSPLLFQGKLFIQVIHRDTSVSGRPAPGAKPADSYLLAIEAGTGKDIWKQIRNSDARGEAKESYGTPMPYEHDGKADILIVGGDYVTAHDSQTGKELWRCGGWNPTHINHLRVVPSVVMAGELAIICTPKVGGQVFAIKPGGSGDVTATHIAWVNKGLCSDVPIPLYYQGQLFSLDGDFKKGLTCLDPATGKVKWFTPITSRPVLRTSPTGADGKIYIMNEAGDIWVLSTADGKVLCTLSLPGEGTARASIAVSQGQCFVRTGDKLHCLGRK